jgi:uncharacterized protein (TIGR00251 family)
METRPVRLTLRVAPGARTPGVVGRHGAGWKVRVTAAPERGRANDELVALLAETLGLHRPDVRVVAGASGRDKVVELAGMTLDEIESRLAAVGKESG